LNLKKLLNLFILSSFIVLLPFQDVDAKMTCSPFDFNGVQICEVGIDSNLASQVSKPQKKDQWCWAASISMIFSYYGHPISQERIVKETWGNIVNLPASPEQIIIGLNREWIDDKGEKFTAQGDVLTANVVTASYDLANDMPLIIGTVGHAMVLTSLTYYRDIYGNGIPIKAIVRDPWPTSGNKRMLSPYEYNMTNFLIRIRVY